MRDKTLTIPFPLPQLHSKGVMALNLYHFKDVMGGWLLRFPQELYPFPVCHQLSLIWWI